MPFGNQSAQWGMGSGMRFVFALLALAMAAFAAVQYNDPDGPLWAAYYAVPALWAALAALQPRLIATAPARVLLGLSVAAGVALTLYYWPPIGGWWRRDVWSMALTEERAAQIAEQSREGMGMMMATAVLVLLLIVSLRNIRRI